MGNPYVYYRISSPAELKHVRTRSVSSLDWGADLAMIQRFYARFGRAVRPDGFGEHVGSPLAVVQDGEIVSLAIPLSFRAGETEIGGVATVPDRRGEGCCEALIAEMAFRILREGKAAVLTTEKDNLPIRKAAERIGMKRISEECDG